MPVTTLGREDENTYQHVSEFETPYTFCRYTPEGELHTIKNGYNVNLLQNLQSSAGLQLAMS